MFISCCNFKSLFLSETLTKRIGNRRLAVTDLTELVVVSYVIVLTWTKHLCVFIHAVIHKLNGL